MDKKSVDIPGININGNITINGPMFDIHDNQNVYFYDKGTEKLSKADPNFNPSGETYTKSSDFEHLKVWQDNTDLDYYLSESHWNYHVNHLLYTYLKARYNGNEVGVYINLALHNGSQSNNIDYNQIYGVMFNEAYRICKYVLTTPVPETKITKLEKEAAELCHVELAAPIVSYNILVMTCLILCFANDQKNVVGRFLKYLSFHNSTHYFGDEFHHFEDYIRIGLESVAAIMIDSRLQPGKLRQGYDYESKDKYLRNTIPWYRDSAEKLEKRVKEANEKTVQPTDITDVPSGKNNNGRKRGRGKQLKVIPSPPKYMTLKYVTHANKGLTEKQRKRVHYLYEKWKTPEVKQSDGGWCWLDASVAYTDFCDLFEGADRCCNLKNKRGKTNVLSIFFTRLLNYIPKGKNKPLIEYQTNQSAQQIMVEQFGVNAINNLKRLISKSPTDIKRLKESIYILDWTAPLPPMYGGGDTDYDMSDEALQRYSANIDLGIEHDANVEQAVKSGVLRKGKHT